MRLLAFTIARSLAVVLALCASSWAEDWPQFRGPRGDGTSAATHLPTHWSAQKNVRWRVDLPGRSRSSPVVVGERIWLTTAEDSPAPAEEAMAKLFESPDITQMYVARIASLKLLGVDVRSGKIVATIPLWELAGPDPIHRLNSFATPTPVVHRGRVYCDFGAAGTCCVDAATGRVVWTQRQLPCEHLLGAASSPAIAEDRLLVVRDGCDAQYIAGLDLATGRVVWKTDRPPMGVESRYEKKSFSTPLVISASGRTQAVVPGSQWICGYDPATGRELWRLRHGRGYSLAPCPVYGHGLVYFLTGCMTPELWAIRPDGVGDVTASHVVWRAKGPLPMISSPVLVGREVYCVSDNGLASCFGALDGKLLWRLRIGGEHLASPLAGDGKLYFFDLAGRSTVLAAGAAFVKLAENSLSGPLAASPAVAGSALILRTDTQLFCIAEDGPR